MHWFLARLAGQARADGDWEVVQRDPPHRAARYFRHDGTLRSMHPDAFGLLRRGETVWPFFLEWERRALHPSTMASRLAPYLRYYSASRPLGDNGAEPAVLVVFENPVAPEHFVRVARQEMARARVAVPLSVSCTEDLEVAGPLGAAWRTSGSTEAACAFA